MQRLILAIILIIFPWFKVLAGGENPKTFADFAQEERYHELTEHFRCVVCQNQSVADSNSKVAQAVRDLVFTLIQEGKSDQDIKAHLVASYGDFVLYDPPLKPTTYFLWGGPLLLLLLAFSTLIYFIRRHAQTTAVAPVLTEDERTKITKLLEK